MNPVVKDALMLMGGAVAYAYREEIQAFATTIFDLVVDRIITRHFIKRAGNEKIIYAIIKHIEKNDQKRYSQYIVNQRNNVVDYSLPNGTYILYYDEWFLMCTIRNEDIAMWTLYKGTEYLREALSSIYEPEDEDDKQDVPIIFYMSTTDKWNVPIFRRKRLNLHITASAQTMLDDVEKFTGEEAEYENDGNAYRRGYFIEGAPGTYKSSIVELLAAKYDMCVYMINVNSAGMNDTLLISLVNCVPPKSLIVFDEFDKQYTRMRNNRNMSSNGILSALDGPIRLSHGSIAIMIVNSRAVFPQALLTQLLRIGRLDVPYTFV